MLCMDETGHITNQLKDGGVGNELFVLLKAGNECEALTGATTVSLHGSAIYFRECEKSFQKQEIKEIPIHWKTGLDISYTNIYKAESVMQGGPYLLV